jgi:hypothetical protein
MSYSHIHLPKLDELKKQLENNPDSIVYYTKYESVIGPCDSVAFLEDQYREYKIKQLNKGYENKENRGDTNNS